MNSGVKTALISTQNSSLFTRLILFLNNSTFSVSCKSSYFKTAEDCFGDIESLEWFATEDQWWQSYHFATDFDHIAAAGKHCEHPSNTVYNAQLHQLHVHLRKWTLICWITLVILIKYVVYIAKIVTYKVWKLGSNP